MNVPLFNRRRFKYLDEASFHSLSLRKRYGRAPAGKPLILKDPVYEVSTFNITLVCALRFQWYMHRIVCVRVCSQRFVNFTIRVMCDVSVHVDHWRSTNLHFRASSAYVWRGRVFNVRVFIDWEWFFNGRRHLNMWQREDSCRHCNHRSIGSCIAGLPRSTVLTSDLLTGAEPRRIGVQSNEILSPLPSWNSVVR
jgi:hypothetical protein